MAIICPKCQRENPEDTLYCVKCGASMESAERKGLPGWLSVDTKTLSGRVVAFPKREEITIPIQEQFIVELYSR